METPTECWCCGLCEFAWCGGDGSCPNCGSSRESHCEASMDEMDEWIDEQADDYPAMKGAWCFDERGTPLEVK